MLPLKFKAIINTNNTLQRGNNILNKKKGEVYIIEVFRYISTKLAIIKAIIDKQI